MAKFKSKRPRADEIFSLPSKFEELIGRALEAEGLRLTQTEKIAAAVKRQSDYYIENPNSPTPWNADWARVAQWAYYLPLNYLRAKRVCEMGKRLGFFDDIRSAYELGSGLGAASLAVVETCRSNSESTDGDYPFSGRAFEIDPEAIEGFQQVQKIFSELKDIRVGAELSPGNEDLTESLGVFSYVVNELDDLPKWAFQCEALFIMEPASHNEGRKLLELREKLIGGGFHIWAPCTHQEKCPLLEHSKKDWCHDRLHWEMPDWFEAIDRELPIKNNTLTMSYLLARKTLPPDPLETSSFDAMKFIEKARVVGDLLHEKGKSRALICRGTEREYLSWLHKKSDGLDLARGDLIKVPPQAEKKGNEVRI